MKGAMHSGWNSTQLQYFVKFGAVQQKKNILNDFFPGQ